MVDNGYRVELIKKSDKELLEMVTDSRDQYTIAALADAENILHERGVDFVIFDANEEEVEEVSSPTTVTPLIMGIAFKFIEIFILFSNIERQYIGLIALIIIIICVFYISNLIEKYNLSKTLWIVLGIIFGSLALVFINFAIWLDPSPREQKPEIIEEESNDEEDTNIVIERLESFAEEDYNYAITMHKKYLDDEEIVSLLIQKGHNKNDAEILVEETGKIAITELKKNINQTLVGGIILIIVAVFFKLMGGNEFIGYICLGSFSIGILLVLKSGYLKSKI